MMRYRVQASRFPWGPGRTRWWYVVSVSGPNSATVDTFSNWQEALDLAIEYADKDRRRLVGLTV